jgi:long-chain acyl-CoA synthetase
VLLVLPLSHIYALNVGLGACVQVGATMVLMERFDPTTSLDTIERHGSASCSALPPCTSRG